MSVFYNRGMVICVAIFCAILISLNLTSDVHQDDGPLFLAFMAGFYIILIIGVSLGSLTLMTWLNLFLGKGKGIVGGHELEISRDGLWERTEFNESLHKWNGISAVKESRSFYFVRCSESGGSFHLIPKRIPVEGDLTQFIAELRGRIGTAQQIGDGNAVKPLGDERSP